MQYAFCSQYCTWPRSHRGRHCACAFYIYTLLMYTNTCIQSKPSSDQRCSRDRNCETETWSKVRDRDFIKKSGTRDVRFEIDTATWKFVDCGNIFLKFSKKCHHHFEIEFFSNFWHFSCLLWSFLTCRYSRQKAHWITEILLCHIVAVLKFSNNRLVTKTCSLRDRDETETFENETRKNGSGDESQARDGVSRLHHW